MKQYLEACNYILSNGTRKANRTGVDTLSVHGMMMKFDLQEGFPAVTTKELNFKAVVAELLGFIRGYDNARQFRELGTRIWDANANENPAWLANPNRKGPDDLGNIYGVQWRRFGGEVDQLAQVIDKLSQGIDDRRLIVTAWDPIMLDTMALPPCHTMFQFGLLGDQVNLCMYQRSADFPLGVPFNIASYALLLSLVARIVNKRPGVFTHFLWDCHVYVNQIEALQEQLERPCRPLPRLSMSPFINSLRDLETWVTPDCFQLRGYNPHPAIKFPFTV